MSTPVDNRRRIWRLALLVALLILAACTQLPPAPSTPSRVGVPVDQRWFAAATCAHPAAGPINPPHGAIIVDPHIAGDLAIKTGTNPTGSIFWLAPGVHILGTDQFDQVAVKDGNTYVGAPGAVLDGQGKNRYAFTTPASNVTLRYLTVRGFSAPQDQGVVNHDSGDGWVIEDNVIEHNKGAGLMAGARQQVRRNCLRNNGQYALNAYQAGNGITGLVLENNEIVGNNTEGWESRVPGCGCSGGVKFWSVNGADIRSNWIHDNRGAGLWADTNNNDFLIEGNLIEDNDGEALFYEISYNLVMRGNMVRRNALVEGRKFSQDEDNFPVGAVYISESGGEPRIPARNAKIEITDNVFEDNWSGITAWENADRFCNSPANTSTGVCTLVVPDASMCAIPGIATEPLYDDCRWKTQRVDIHRNTFSYDPATLGCHPGYAARQAMLSNFGTFPLWSPYKGDRIQQAITTRQDVRWRDNSYAGPWTFTIAGTGTSYDFSAWQAEPYGQDKDSTFSDRPAPSC